MTSESTSYFPFRRREKDLLTLSVSVEVVSDQHQFPVQAGTKLSILAGLILVFTALRSKIDHWHHVADKETKEQNR